MNRVCDGMPQSEVHCSYCIGVCEPCHSIYALFLSTLQVETEWVNVSRDLSGVPSLEPLLLKRLLSNASREGAALGACLQLMGEERSVEVDKAKLNHRRCQV